MIKINLKIFAAFALALLITPHVVGAQSTTGEESWGGLHLVTLDSSVCTCSGNSYWILDYKTNSLLMLYYQAGQSKIYSGFNLNATYQLGTYSYASQACSINVGEGCVDLQNMGTYGMLPGTGTSYTLDSSNAFKSVAKADASAIFNSYKPMTAPSGSYFTAIKKTFKGLSF